MELRDLSILVRFWLFTARLPPRKVISYSPTEAPQGDLRIPRGRGRPLSLGNPEPHICCPRVWTAEAGPP